LIPEGAPSDDPEPQAPRVVIVGGGFGGISAARALAHAPVAVTIVDRHNFHTFAGIRFWGMLGWLSWLALHLVFLIGFRNRVVVLVKLDLELLQVGPPPRDRSRLPPSRSASAPRRVERANTSRVR
jgi:hypothetical protein